ncbi:MAG: hypothetical protein JWN14_4503 [Chthonomonadales bacterium]|nr:hypothetical protein [Chthonomonadales bacterium]
MNHLTTQQIESYQDGTLESAAEYLAIEAHLADCAECRERLGATSRTLSEGLRRFLADSAHPTGAVLVRYVRNSAEVPEIIAQHVAVCARCRQDVAALQAYRQSVTPEIWAEARAALEVWVSRSRSGGRLRASLQAAFSRQALRVWAPATAVCLLLLAVFWWRNQPIAEIADSAGRWTLARSGKLTGPIAFPPALELILRKALQDRTAATPSALTALASADDAHYRPAGIVVRSDMPKLGWEATPNAVSYQCILTSPDDPTFKRAAPKPIPGTSWTMKKPLPRGKVYTWQVVATLRNGRHVALSGSPRFKVLEPAQAQALDQAAKIYAGSHLTLGLLYAQEGVLDEAEQEVSALLALNPNSPIVKTLLDRLRAQHRNAQ